MGDRTHIPWNCGHCGCILGAEPTCTIFFSCWCHTLRSYPGLNESGKALPADEVPNSPWDTGDMLGEPAGPSDEEIDAWAGVRFPQGGPLP